MKCALSPLLTMMSCCFGIVVAQDQNAAQVGTDSAEKQATEFSPMGSPVFVKNIERRAPFLGVPVPWKLSDGDIIGLRRIRVESHLLNSCAETNVILSMRNTSDKDCKVMMAIPVMMDSSVVPDGLSAEWGITELKIRINGEETSSVDYQEEVFHPQKEAPSLSLLQKVNRWIVFPVRFKANEELLVEMRSILPYGRVITHSEGKENIEAPLFKFYLNSGRLWKDELHWGSLCLDPKEMNVSRLSILEPQEIKWGKKNGDWYDWPLTSNDLARVNPLSLKIAAPVQYLKNGRVRAAGGEGTLSRNFTVKASSSLDEKQLDQIKTAEGAWADGVSGDGQGEWVELTLNNEAPLLGLSMVNGRNPAFMGEEERKHPDLTHSFYGSVKKASITLNNEYTFVVTLFDDWCPQFIEAPDYNKPVKTIKLQLDEVRGGKSSDDTYISELLPVLKK